MGRGNLSRHASVGTWQGSDPCHVPGHGRRPRAGRLCEAGSPVRVKALDPRGRVRDAAPPADGRPREAAAARRRAADGRLDARQDRRGRRRRRDPPRHERALRRRLRALGRRPRVASTTTARPRTRTASARSATSSSSPTAQEWEGEDVLVVAGDNLFDFSLADYVDWWRDKGRERDRRLRAAEPRAREPVQRRRARRRRPRLSASWRSRRRPESNLTAIATYIYNRAHLALLRAYLAEGNSPDQPGHFIAWLHTRAPVYGYRFAGEWLDIGDRVAARGGGQPLPPAGRTARTGPLSAD